MIRHPERLVNVLWLGLIGTVPLVQLYLRYRRNVRVRGKAQQTLCVAVILLGLFVIAIIAQLLGAFGIVELGPVR